MSGWPNDPNQWGKRPGFSNQPPMYPGFQDQHPINPGYEVVESPRSGPPPRIPGVQLPIRRHIQNQHPASTGHEVIANPIPGVHMPLQRHVRNQHPANTGYQIVENPPLGGTQTINLPRVRHHGLRPAQMQPSRFQNSGASCEACWDMNPRLQPESRVRLNPNRINIYITAFLRASNECLFCDLLLRIFLKYVNSAEEKIQRAERKGSHSMSDPVASVVIESDRPIVITFSEGMHGGASVSRDEIVSGDEDDPRKVYYPPPIQLYCPAGNVAPPLIHLLMLK